MSDLTRTGPDGASERSAPRVSSMTLGAISGGVTDMTDQEITPDDSTSVLYQASVQHWSHAEQIRWTLLYNSLMASTILLLAWATVFASLNPQSISWPKRIGLVALPTAGFLLSAMWIALGLRASSFVEMYAGLGGTLETTVSRTTVNKPSGPFCAASTHRATLSGAASWATSRRVLFWVPFFFVCVYGLLILISISEG